MSATPILVIGATGSIGGLVVKALVEHGYPVRASSRHPVNPGHLGAVETTVADYDDPHTITSAAAGIRTAFIYTPNRNASQSAAALRDAGVQRVVMLSSGSVLLPGAENIPSAVMHRDAENAFAEQIDDFLPIRPLRLALDALRWASTIREHNEVSLYRPDALSAPLHEQDVADIALHALVTGDEAATGPMSGPSLLTQAEQISILGAAVGRDIKIHEQSPDEAVAEFARSSSPQAAKATVAFLDNAAAGRSPVMQTIPMVLGRPARDFQSWVTENRDRFI